MDELWEVLCLMQEKKMPKMPVFLVGSKYWRSFDTAIQAMLDLKMVAEDDSKIFKITDDIEEIVEAANKIGHPKINENFYDGFREASKIAQNN